MMSMMWSLDAYQYHRRPRLALIRIHRFAPTDAAAATARFAETESVGRLAAGCALPMAFVVLLFIMAPLMPVAAGSA
jgi:hypothetical protein